MNADKIVVNIYANQAEVKEEQAQVKGEILAKGGPSLDKYYGTLKAGKEYTVMTRLLTSYIVVGSVEFTELSQTVIAFNCSYEFLGHGAQVKVRFTTNSSYIEYNGRKVLGSYEEVGDTLRIYFNNGIERTSIDIQWWGDGLWIGGEAMPNKAWMGYMTF